MSAEQLTTAEKAVLWFLLNIWFVVSFYVHLPIINDENYEWEEMHDLANLITIPTFALVKIKEFFTDIAYHGVDEGGNKVNKGG